VTLQGTTEGTSELEDGIRETVAERIGKFARPKRIWATTSKTRSGKIMRRLLRDIAEDARWATSTTLRDPDVVERLGRRIATPGGLSQPHTARALGTALCPVSSRAAQTL